MRNKVWIIGVTGGVGAGKSEILKYLAERYRCRVIYTDRVANDLKLKGAPCYQAIIDLLGAEILDADGEIDKRLMAQKIFQDVTLLEQVNGILHPAVYDYVTDAIRTEQTAGVLDYLFLEAALLIEAGYGKIVDEMWYVHAEEDVRRNRLKASRGYDNDRIDGILKGQLSEAAYRAGADFVIDNSGALQTACEAIDLHLEDLAKGKSQ